MTPTICSECFDTLTEKDRLEVGTGKCEACESCVCHNCENFIPEGALKLNWEEGRGWECEDCYSPSDDEMNDY